MLAVTLLSSGLTTEAAQEDARVDIVSSDTYSVQPANEAVNASLEAQALISPSQLWAGDPIPSASGISYVEGLEHVTVHQAIEGEYQFLHGASIVYHEGTFYSAWANSPVNENSEDEVVRGRRSDDGGYTWSEIELIAPDLPGSASRSHGAFFSHDGDLWYFANRIVPGPDPGRTDAYKLNEVTDLWEPIASPAVDFVAFDEPTLMSNGKWVVGGSTRALTGGAAPAVAYFDDNNVTSWTVVEIPVPSGSNLIFPETSVWVNGNEVTAVIRNSNQNLALISVSDDYGQTWTTAGTSNFTMAASKPFAGTLSNGQRYLISNLDGARSTLTIAVSKPNEESLVKIWKIRDGISPEPLYPDDFGVKKPQWSYPYAVEHEGSLYVVYSMGKEDAGLSIFPIASLNVDEQPPEEEVIIPSQLIAYETFDNYTGDIDQGTDGNGWTGNWSAASANTTAQSTNLLGYAGGDVAVSGGAASVQHVSDSNNPQLWRTFEPQTGTLYFSLLMQLPATADDEFVGFHFTDSGNGGLDNTPSAEVGLYGGGGSPGFVRAGMYNPSNNRGVASEVYTNGDTLFVVGRISDEGPDTTPGNYDRLELYVNPTTLFEPAAASLAAEFVSTLTSLDTFAVRTANLTSGESAYFDELRIGTTYASVVRSDLVGDYNHNGIVDAADYTLWRDTLGQSVLPGTGADGRGDGTIDETDFDVWRANFGHTLDFGPSGAASISTSVKASATLDNLAPDSGGQNTSGPLHAFQAVLQSGSVLRIWPYASGTESIAARPTTHVKSRPLSIHAIDHAWEHYTVRSEFLQLHTVALRERITPLEYQSVEASLRDRLLEDREDSYDPIDDSFPSQTFAHQQPAGRHEHAGVLRILQ